MPNDVSAITDKRAHFHLEIEECFMSTRFMFKPRLGPLYRDGGV